MGSSSARTTARPVRGSACLNSDDPPPPPDTAFTFPAFSPFPSFASLSPSFFVSFVTLPVFVLTLVRSVEDPSFSFGASIRFFTAETSPETSGVKLHTGVSIVLIANNIPRCSLQLYGMCLFGALYLVWLECRSSAFLENGYIELWLSNLDSMALRVCGA